MSQNSLELTILMPCLNEAETLGVCIDKAQNFLKAGKVHGEVLIADNGSTDGSQDIARAKGARVVDVPVRGYGAALGLGIRQAYGKYVIMGDSDDSYDFQNLSPFLDKLREGYQLVMGNRFRGGIARGAMPFLHKYLGNPVLTFIGRLFFNSSCRDFHCGLRGFDRAAILQLDLRTTGMEFASEMVVKSSLRNLRTTEVPTRLSPDGRNRPPHLRTWRDGWRHLRFLLMYSPRWLFYYPGLLLSLSGLLGMALLAVASVKIGGVVFDVHSLVASGTLLIIGSQFLTFAFLAKQYAVIHRLHPASRKIDMLSRYFNLEHILVFGLLVALGGIAGAIGSVAIWEKHHFGPLNYEDIMRVIVPSSVAIIIGLQAMFGAFMAGIMGLAAPADSHLA
jgi:glycosyltransferase involved in cell wall biosynthesis